MYIRSIRVRGFRDLPEAHIENCDRWMDLQGPSPAVTALGDAIELGFSVLSVTALARLAWRWGMVSDSLPPAEEGLDFPEQLDQLDPVAVQAILAPGARRALKVDLELHLDPPLFGRLREHAAREPRVVTALADRPTIQLSVGALFTLSLDTMAIHLDGFAVGNQRFPTHGKDRPAWLNRFLASLRGRFHRFDLEDDFPEQLLDAATSREGHAAYAAWQSALAPDGPSLRVARGADDRPILLGDDQPMRRYGQAGQDRASLAAAIHLSGADILWAESDDDLLKRAVEANPSPLEQVFTVSPRGTTGVQSDSPSDKPAIKGPLAWRAPRS